MAVSQDITTGGVGDSVLKNFQLTTDISSKLDFEYGKAISQYIYSTLSGTSSYYWVRNARFKANRDIANGRINMTKFMDRMEFNGQLNYANLNWACIKIANTVISRIVGQWMSRHEKINVTAVDRKSKDAKKDQADQAEFILNHKAQLAELEQQSGVPMVAQDQFIPEDKGELDQWKMEFNQIPEEIGYELGCNTVMDANGLYDIIKEKLLHDSTEVGFVGTYTEMNDDGEIVSEWVKPENAIYSNSEFPDFRDTSWRGRVRSFKISYLRAKYGIQNGGKLTEQDLWEIAQKCKNYQLNDKLTWLDTWSFAYLRPYDEWNMDGIDFELKSFDKQPHTVTKSKIFPSTRIEKGIPTKIKDNQSVIEEKNWNIYRGVYLPLCEKVLQWGLKENMVIPQDPKEVGNAEFSYSFFMYQNNQMRNIAVPEKIEEPLDGMIMARMKIQQVVAKMIPPGAAINKDALNEMDLGLASGTTKPSEIERIWRQTGSFYYRGKDAEGNPIGVPITELANTGFAPALEVLMKEYQFQYQVLKDELGQDPNLAQQATQPRVANSNVMEAQQYANDSSDYMYDAYLYVMEDTARKQAALLNTSVTYGGKKYREILKEDDVKGRVFETKIQMLPTQEELNKLEAMMNNMITNLPEFVAYCDVFKIMRVAKENIKLGELLFRQAQKRYLKGQADTAKQNSDNNAQVQQQSMQAKAEGDKALQESQLNGQERLALLNGAFAILAKEGQVPTNLQPVLEGIIQNISLPLMVENAQIKQGISQAKQQEIQQQQEQGQQQSQQIPNNQPQPQEQVAA